MSDVRKHERKNTDAYLAVYDHKTGELLGCLVDLTIAGLKILGQKQLKCAEFYILRVELPKAIKGIRKIKVDATTIWSQESVDPSFYATGFKFRKITPQLEKFIELLLDSSLFSRKRIYIEQE